MHNWSRSGSVVFNRSYSARWLLVVLLLFTALLPFTPAVPRALADTTGFGERRPFGQQGEAWSVAVGDLDGDGHLDIVAGGYWEAGTIYFNRDGNGRFPTDSVQIYRPKSTTTTTAIALGDIDADGDLDVVTGNSDLSSEAVGRIIGGAQNVVYMNDNGSFSPARSRLFGPEDSQTTSVVLGDLNGDGALDIVTGNYEQPNRVYLNDGSGNFPAGGEQLPGLANRLTRSIAVGDLNGDDALDIVVGDDGQQNVIYFNDGNGNFPTFNVQPFGPGDSTTWSVAPGDFNADGALDIVVGNDQEYNTIYFNDATGNFLDANSLVISAFSPSTRSLAVGDISGDGVLDIITGSNELNSIEIGTRTSGIVPYTTIPGSSFSGNDYTAGVALGDLNEDGAVDIVAGGNRQGAIFFNTEPGRYDNVPALESSQWGRPVGDLDGDGYLDMIGWDAAVRRIAVYLNNRQGNFRDEDKRLYGPMQSWVDATAVGDLNGDAALDIVIGSSDSPNFIYLNDGQGNFPHRQAFGSADSETVHVALGDLDNDGDLDVVTARTGQNMVYLNDGQGNFPNEQVYAFGADAYTRRVVVGDLDNDGDLDIVSDEDAQSLVYFNDGMGQFLATAARPLHLAGVPLDRTLCDLNGDGSLDIVSVYFGQTWITFNDGSGHFPETQTRSFGTGDESAVYPGDIDGDGDLDLVTDTFRVYRNDGSGHFPQTFLITYGPSNEVGIVGIGDVNNDGTLDFVAQRQGEGGKNTIYLNYLARPTGLPNNPPRINVTRPGSVPDAPLFSTPEIQSGEVIPVPFTLADPEGDPVREVRAFFSLNGGGDWQAAVPTASTVTTNLAADPQGSTHTFNWDLLSSGFAGQSDNLVFRIVAYPGHTPGINGVPGPYQHPSVAAQTTPFRVRGTQVRVLQTDGTPAPDALVYRLPANALRGAEPFMRSTGEPFRTDGQGFLQGRGVITPGDRLIALAPITATATYTLYQTSAAPTATGLDVNPVTAVGVQTLTVAPDQSLILFNLDVALEWDARNDPQYLARLEADLQRASTALYDWTDGHAALGDITLHHDRGPATATSAACDPDRPDECIADYWWNHAHVRIYATNRLRPNANQGGIVTRPISETVMLNGATKPITYEPGQIRMGAVWNRYGEADGTIGEDWPRTLAHELGHYLFFLDDNYLGFAQDGRLIPVQTCAGAMADPYIDNGSELRPAQDWLPACAQTLSQQETGRADWETLARFYDWERLDQLEQPEQTFVLNPPATFNANPGPNTLPLAVTRVRATPPVSPAATLQTPIFYLTDKAGVAVQPDPNSRVFLFQSDRQRLIDLGRPVLDRVEARGARPGDRLCVYNLTEDRLGCESVSADDQQIELTRLSQPWQPDLVITPVTSRTVEIAVERVDPGLPLKAQLYPTGAPAGAPIDLPETGGRYSGTFTLKEPAFTGYVHVWVDMDGQGREIVSDYAIGGNPGSLKRKTVPGDNPGSLKRKTVPRNNPGSLKRKTAPVLSSDGQAILYLRDEQFTEGEFYALQSASVLAPAPWAAVVGQAYRLTATANAPQLQANAAISIGYLSGEVPPGTEGGITIYFRALEGGAWQQLETYLDTERNEATAQAEEPGVYALMTSVTVQPGWNLLAYPWTDTQSVPEALGRINAQGYTTVYGYAQDDTTDPWKVYDIDVPAWVNDLQGLRYGQGYWVRVTDMPAVTQTRSDARTRAAGVPVPPATYYARLSDLGLTQVPAGTTVVARVGGQVCGTTMTFADSATADQVVFAINVPADDGSAAAGCGAPGRTVTFEIDGVALLVSVGWDNSRPRDLAQPNESPARTTYLPLVVR